MSLALERIWERKIAFLGTFFLVFTLSYVVLVALDWLPEPPASEAIELPDETSPNDSKSQVGSTTAEAEPAVATDGEPAAIQPTVTETNAELESDISTSETTSLPVSLVIKKLDKKVTVLNPDSRTIADLDTALLSGVVRHPDSANLSQDGTVFILGHSSYLPTVFNKNFQAFNGIQNLEWGDMIELYSEDQVYEYRVEKVYRAEAKDVTVPIAGNGRTLTLATCNSFGSVDDRYIVEAKQINVRQL